MKQRSPRERSHAWPVVRVLALAGCLATSLSGHAQSTIGTNQLDPEFVKTLMQRIGDLEQKAKRVDALEAEVKSLKTGKSVSESEVTPSIREVWPKIQLNVLGDVDYQFSTRKGEKNSFLLGDIDPIVTAKLSEKAGVLGDFVISSDSDGFGFEIERILLQYSVNDYFNIEAGRFHTAIGYYNNTYHNGAYFQTTTERPSIYLFEDGEGILPVHSTGISVNGEIPSGKLGLRYVAEIANGRDYSVQDSPFRIDDDNDFKAFNLALSARPEWVPGLQVGGSFYHDTLTPTDGANTDQMIMSAYAVYKNAVWEWLNEGVFMRDAPKGDQAHWTSAAYTQVSRKFGKLRPYARFQWRNSPSGDPILAKIAQNVSVWGPTVGLRYDFTPMMALKGEYEHTEQRGEPAFDELRVQWAFRF